jgi:hypothetical protein
MGTARIVRFDSSERDALLTLLFATTVFGWAVVYDLYVVPDNASCTLLTDHHDVVHVTCRAEEDIARWVAHMESRRFPLPTEAPDETFKPQAWLRHNDE